MKEYGNDVNNRNNEKNTSHTSHASHNSPSDERLLPPRGDYQTSFQYIRNLGRKTPQTYEDYRDFVETRPPEVVANIAICLIHQTNYLTDQQLRRLEVDFLEQGGLRERMTRVRLQYRNKNNSSHESPNS